MLWLMSHNFSLVLTIGKLIDLLMFDTGQCYISSSWHWPVVSFGTEWETTSCGSWNIESPYYWTAPFPHVVYDPGFLRTVRLCESSWPWTRCTVYVHHGYWPSSTFHNFCSNNCTISQALVCYCSVRSSIISSSLGSEILCSLCFRF